MMDGTKEKEYKVLMLIGDIMMTQSSGGNSTQALLGSSQKSGKKKNKKKLVRSAYQKQKEFQQILYIVELNIHTHTSLARAD